MITQRKKFLIGNWKMFKKQREAVADFTLLNQLIAQKKQHSPGWEKKEVGIAAPALFLAELASQNASCVNLYAQNAHWEEQGAFTGELSPSMLKSVGVQGSLVAHSERRSMFGETNATAGKRVGALLKAGMTALLCVGETLEERRAGHLQSVLAAQIQQAIQQAALSSAEQWIGSDVSRPHFLVAYEPVWAIGTGQSATAKEAQEAHLFIRQCLAKAFDVQFADMIPILYGGSVKSGNIQEFMTCSDVDGALVGGASLQPTEFAELCAKIE